MAVFREPPKCPFCKKVIAKAIHTDYGGIPLIQRPIGDSFVRWEYKEHNCKERKIFLNKFKKSTKR